MAPAISVLVADDEADMRLLVRAVLEGAGFEVVEEAIDGDDALVKIAQLDPPPIPSVMVLDNRMPGMSGIHVAERVLAEHPGQRIILFSAFLDDAVRAEADATGITRCVSKSDIHALPAIIAALVAT